MTFPFEVLGTFIDIGSRFARIGESGLVLRDAGFLAHDNAPFSAESVWSTTSFELFGDTALFRANTGRFRSDEPTDFSNC